MAKATQTRKKVKWLRYVLLAVGGLGIYHIVSGPSGAFNIFRLKKENAKQDRELDSLQARKQELETEKVRLVKDSAYMEKVARKELGMAKPNEKVFRFMPDNGGSRDGGAGGGKDAGAGGGAAGGANKEGAAGASEAVGAKREAVLGGKGAGDLIGGSIGNNKVTPGADKRTKR